MKKLIYLIIFILSIQIASAAILHGTIYDTNLNKLNDVVVEVEDLSGINESTQTFVSKEGQYSFVLDPGTYKVIAKYHIGADNYLYSTANVTIAKNGYFLMDLFLRPAKKVEMPTGAVIGIGNLIIPYTVLISIISIILVLALGYTVYRLKFAQPPDNQGYDDYTNDLLKAIKQEGGRTTQKDIRKKIVKRLRALQELD